jgi:hypothetical protein
MPRSIHVQLLFAMLTVRIHSLVVPFHSQAIQGGTHYCGILLPIMVVKNTGTS